MNAGLAGIGKFISNLTNNKFFIYIVFGVLAYLGWKRLTKPVDEAFLETPIPNGGKDIPSTWKPTVIVQRLHDYYDSFFHDSDFQTNTLAMISGLSDGQFVVMVQTYNATWAKKDGVSVLGDSNITLWKRANSWKRILFGQGVKFQDKFIERMTQFKVNY